MSKLGSNLNIEESQKAALWDILDSDGAGSVHKDGVFDLLDMLVNQNEPEQRSGNELIEGLRTIGQQLFKDSDTTNIDASVVYQYLDKLNSGSKEDILVQLKKIERNGKISRTKLDDLIAQLEEVSAS